MEETTKRTKIQNVMDKVGKPYEEVAKALSDAGWDEQGAIDLLATQSQSIQKLMELSGKPYEEVAAALIDAGWEEGGAIEHLIETTNPDILTEEEVMKMTEEEAIQYALNKSRKENFLKEDQEEAKEEKKPIKKRGSYKAKGPITSRGTQRIEQEDQMTYLRAWRKKRALEQDKPKSPKRPKKEPRPCPNCEILKARNAHLEEKIVEVSNALRIALNIAKDDKDEDNDDETPTPE